MSKSPDYKISFDPAWYSLALPGRETSLTTFTIELIEEIGKAEKVSIEVDQRSWSNLMYALQAGECDAICSTMQPYLFYEKLYDFSELYLMTGPVLVTSTKAPTLRLDQMSGKIIGIVRDSQAALILEKYPDIIQRTYESIQPLLMDTAQENIDGAMADVLTAEAFTKDLFQNQLKISSAPFTEAGVRILALRSRDTPLIKVFNRGLAVLKKNGTYSALAKKWNLSESKR